MRESVTLRCHKCNRSFQVLEDERFAHDCPHCGPEEHEDEHWGCDAIGDEIYLGDEIVETPDGEIILEENLEDYLIERLGFVFKKAE